MTQSEYNEAMLVAAPEEQLTPIAIQPLTLFGTADPVEVLARATRTANALAKVINEKHLFAMISNRKYVTVTGWTLLGSMLGVFPRVDWTRKLEDGWEARAEAVVAASGMVIGAGEAQCTRKESTWKSRDDYALRSMAQTRAISRALRGPLDFVVELGGFAPTPAEEMPTADAQFVAKERVRRQRASQVGPEHGVNKPATPVAEAPPTSPDADGDTGDMEYLRRLGMTLPKGTQTAQQVDDEVMKDSYARVKMRLHSKHLSYCGLSCPHIERVG